MRISLLQQREPFGPIIERTLSQYWTKRCHQPIKVNWVDQPGAFARVNKKEQAWFCNIYLNAIFPACVKSPSFDPLRREFARSLTWWRRPAQQAYVQAASNPQIAKYFAQAWINVSKPVPGAESQIIVPGNHKIRILDHQAGTSTSVLKKDFDSLFFHNEIKTRQVAEKVGVPTPRLLTVDEANGWFEEQYILGTPVNRLADQTAIISSVQTVMKSLQPLYEATATEQTTVDYVHALAQRAIELIDSNALFDDTLRLSFSKIVRRCVDEVVALNPRTIVVNCCHGDFQPANILVDGSRTWLIDWEYSRYCQSGYDTFVYWFHARYPRGLVARLRSFVTYGLPEWILRVSASGPFLHEKVDRACAVYIFLLEELILHLQENANPLFLCLGNGLKSFEWELHSWILEKDSLFEKLS